MGGLRTNDRKGTEGTRVTLFGEKLVALRAYLQAKGLCHTCGERWSREHKCGPTIQLHVVEELWEMLRNAEVESQSADEEDLQLKGELLAILQEAWKGSETVRTMRLQGLLQGHEVIMLVDSRSSHCFINEEFAHLLAGDQLAFKLVQVRIANGGLLRCIREFPHCQWSIQGITFCTNFKILPLGCYDIILGMDWLEHNSLMNVRWLKKSLSFWTAGRRICLQGIKDSTPQCSMVWSKSEKDI